MSFVERMKEIIGQGVETTKVVLSSAAEKAKELGEIGVLKYEINQLENQVEKRFALLGSNVYATLVEKNQNTVSKNNSEIKELIIDIEEMKENIEKKEDTIKQISEKKEKK